MPAFKHTWSSARSRTRRLGADGTETERVQCSLSTRFDILINAQARSLPGAQSQTRATQVQSRPPRSLPSSMSPSVRVHTDMEVAQPQTMFASRSLHNPQAPSPSVRPSEPSSCSHAHPTTSLVLQTSHEGVEDDVPPVRTPRLRMVLERWTYTVPAHSQERFRSFTADRNRGPARSFPHEDRPSPGTKHTSNTHPRRKRAYIHPKKLC